MKSPLTLNKIYVPWWEWEEVAANMWGTVSDRGAYVQWAVEFTGNHKLYGAYMMRVIQKWPKSCAHNLTDKSQNRRAWIGHAACALASKCPEDIVRIAWGMLTEKQQARANFEADKAIKEWECQNGYSIKTSMKLL